jgi:hypothetical protein
MLAEEEMESCYRRGALAAALVFASAAIAAGCGFEQRLVSPEPAPEKLPRAAAALPLEARVELSVEPENDLTAQLVQHEWLGGDEAKKKNSLPAAQEALRARVAETGLFATVYAQNPGRRVQPREVLLRVDEHVASIPNYWDVFRVISVIPPFYPLAAIYSERSDPLEIEYALRLVDARADVVGEVHAQATIRVNAQVMDGWIWHGRLAAEDMARKYAFSVLAGKLASDPAISAALQKIAKEPAPFDSARPPDALRSGRAEGVRAPAPAPVYVAPPAPAPAPAPEPEPVPSTFPAGSGTTYALVVGVNLYEDPQIPALRFAESDARAVFGFLTTDPRSPCDPDRVELLLGREATRVGILKKIREHLAVKASRPEDMVLLYFAGHGFADAAGTYLAGVDARLDSLPETAISTGTIGEFWSKIRAGRKVLIADACHSGGLGGIRGVGGVTLAPSAAAAAADPSAAQTLTIAATGPNEVSSEDARLGEGVFTIALLTGLRGAADQDKDGRVSADELARYLRREVPALAARAAGKQTPAIDASPGAGAMPLTR